MTNESTSPRIDDAATDHLLTGEEFFELGDIGPCELLDGRIVPMTPTGAEHSQVESVLVRLVGNFVDQNARGWVLAGEVGIYTQRNPDRVRGADLAFVSRQQTATIPKGFLDFGPDLVVEVVSPNDRWTDIREKIDEYFGIGVRQVWIVEPPSRQVLVYASATTATRYGMGEKLQGTEGLAGLEIEVERIFA